MSVCERERENLEVILDEGHEEARKEGVDQLEAEVLRYPCILSCGFTAWVRGVSFTLHRFRTVDWFLPPSKGCHVTKFETHRALHTIAPE